MALTRFKPPGALRRIAIVEIVFDEPEGWPSGVGCDAQGWWTPAHLAEKIRVSLTLKDAPNFGEDPQVRTIMLENQS